MAASINSTVEWQAQRERPPPEYDEYYTQVVVEDWRVFTLLQRVHQIKSWIRTSERMEARFNVLENKIADQDIKIADQDTKVSYLMRQFNVIKGRGLLKIISAITPTRDAQKAYTGFELVANKRPEDLQELIDQFNHLSHALTLAEARSLFFTMWENSIGSFVGWHHHEQEEYSKLLFGMTGTTLKRITELGGKFISCPFM